MKKILNSRALSIPAALMIPMLFAFFADYGLIAAAHARTPEEDAANRRYQQMDADYRAANPTPQVAAASPAAAVPAVPAECNDEYYSVHPDLLQKAFDKVVEDSLDAAGKAAIANIKRVAKDNAASFSGMFSRMPTFMKFLDNLPKIAKGIEVAEAAASGDYNKLKSIGLEVGAEQVMTEAGVPFAGPIVATAQIVKLSMDELKHWNCLLNIDIAYYRFLDDPRLKAGAAGDPVAYYLKNYIRGPGDRNSLDPQGKPIGTNRGYLQCFIDEELPADQRVDVAQIGPLGPLAEAMDTAVPSPAMRTAINVMLKDFNAKRTAEKEKKKVESYVNRSDFKALKAALPALGNYPLLSQWICDAFVKLVREKPKPVAAKPSDPRTDQLVAALQALPQCPGMDLGPACFQKFNPRKDGLAVTTFLAREPAAGSERTDVKLIDWLDQATASRDFKFRYDLYKAKKRSPQSAFESFAIAGQADAGALEVWLDSNFGGELREAGKASGVFICGRVVGELTMFISSGYKGATGQALVDATRTQMKGLLGQIGSAVRGSGACG